MLRNVKRRVRSLRERRQLPPAARRELDADREGGLREDPGGERAIQEAVAWLARAQDRSQSADGGVARHFSLIDGWSASYPEVSGYIAPTLLEYAGITDNAALRDRAKRVLDWLVSIQLPDGAFQGGRVDAKPVAPVVFNTGQILMGLASGVKQLGEEYREPLVRAADWLVAVQDPDGCWRKHSSPFAASGEKTYDTHVAWGLLEAAKVEPGKPYADAALANVRWALGHQVANGWIGMCCLTDPSAPLTHTIGYFLRGILEAYRHSGDASLLESARRTADGILSALRDDGFLPGRLDRNWRSSVPWACLTGIVQIAHCWLILFEETGHVPYRDAAYAGNQFVRRTIRVEGKRDVCGGVKGSYPVDGGYCRYQYLSWAAKFFVDSHLLEQRTRQAGPRPAP